MTIEKKSWGNKLGLIALIAFVVSVVAYGSYAWKENKAMDEMVSGGLTIINYMDREVYASVHYSRFPKTGDGAGFGVGPNAGGGGLMCCVPIPARWRPGIKMIVWYSFKDWQPENGETKFVELPEYPDGRPGDLVLVFHGESEFELFSTIYGPRHPRWPGRRVEPMLEGVE